MANHNKMEKKMKIKLSKKQWEITGIKAGWKKEAQGRMDRNEEEMYPSTGRIPNKKDGLDADVLIQTEHIQKMQKMLHAIDLAIPCLEDWISQTGYGETNQRDKQALNALKESIKDVEHLRGHGF